MNSVSREYVSDTKWTWARYRRGQVIMTETLECVVCLEDFESSKIITCIACQNTSCDACTRKYLLQSIERAHCMNPNCHIGWDAKFMFEHFPKSWINGTKPHQYRHSRKKVLLDMQKALIPATMPLMEGRLNMRKQDLYIHYRNYMYDQMHQDQKALEIKIHYYQLMKPPGYEERIERLRAKLDLYTSRNDELVDTYTAKIRHFADRIGYTSTAVGTREKHNHYEFICQCPVPDCRGLISKKSAKCLVCETKICRKCRCVDHGETPCDSDILVNVRAIRDETKPCPKCAVPIYKMGGCDQMWCVQCRIAFSWNTGRIETHHIHNPHAIRWLRENQQLARDPNDIPCGGMIQLHGINKEDDYHTKTHCGVSDARKVLDAFYTMDYVIQGYRNNFEQEFVSLRLDYIERVISDEKFEQRIFNLTRKSQKRQKIHEILTTVHHLAIERFQAQFNKSLSKHDFYRDLHKLAVFCNETMDSEMIEFGGRYPAFVMGEDQFALRR